MKSYKNITYLLAITFALLFTACTSFISPQPVTSMVPHGLTKEQVRIDIADGCDIRNMTYKDISDNEIEAVHSRENISISFSIKYDESQYTIMYKDSQNLATDDGRVHSNYLRWVNNLKKSIDIELSKTKFHKK